VLLGAFKVYPSITILSTLGILLNAAFFLWVFQKIFLGPLNETYNDLKDVTGRELVTLVPLGALIIFLGVYPMPILNLMKNTLNQLLIIIQAG